MEQERNKNHKDPALQVGGFKLVLSEFVLNAIFDIRYIQLDITEYLP